MRILRTFRRTLMTVLAVAGALAAALLLYAWVRAHSEDLPGTPPDLSAPIGPLTGAKLTALGRDPPLCRALLARAGVHDRPAAAVTGPAPCGYADGMRVVTGGARALAYRPAAPAVRCAVAASLAMWEWDVVQPAAIRRFGVPVAGVDHFGSYACRRIAGSGAASWSEHAHADALDVAGFRLADGRRVAVARDWRGPGPAAAFLHDVRDGACRLFATVLSPEYNSAHRDHLHLDQAARGAAGWRACR